VAAGAATTSIEPSTAMTTAADSERRRLAR